MGNRNILLQKIGAVEFSAVVFDGKDGSESGKCGIYTELFSASVGAAGIRSYGNAADLRRLGEAFLAASVEAEKESWK